MWGYTRLRNREAESNNMGARLNNTIEIDSMKKDTHYVIVRGEVGDIDSIVQFQADMAMEPKAAFSTRRE